MAASQYEVLRCDDCGRKLGYIYINAKIFPPRSYIHLTAGGPLERVEKLSFAKIVFKKESKPTRLNDDSFTDDFDICNEMKKKEKLR